MYAYIDESGDTGYTKKSTRYFIVTALIVEDPFVLRRIAKNVYKYNLDNKKLNILHANKETRSVKNKLIKMLVTSDIKCVSVVLDKAVVCVEDLYILALQKIIQHFSTWDIQSLVIARKDTRKSYNQKITQICSNQRVKFIFSTQTSEKSLQIADFYCWTLFSYYEHNRSDYFNKLKQQITVL